MTTHSLSPFPDLSLRLPVFITNPTLTHSTLCLSASRHHCLYIPPSLSLLQRNTILDLLCLRIALPFPTFLAYVKSVLLCTVATYPVKPFRAASVLHSYIQAPLYFSPLPSSTLPPFPCFPPIRLQLPALFKDYLSQYCQRVGGRLPWWTSRL